MADLSIRNVAKSFGTVPVIRGVSVDVDEGEFVTLVGPSGCGKSTLLRLVAGLEDITSGEITIGEKRVNDVPPSDRDIAMVFQNYALYPHMTVGQNMGFSMRLRRAPREERERLTREAADILNLDELLERYPRQLSGGQRQRVAMGRAIVRKPQVFLFDEPLSNLDAKLRVQMRTEIKALHQRLGATTIYVTHDQVEAMTMADKIVVLRDGIVEQVGAPLELYDRPDNTFVATFIGSPAMNLLQGSVTPEGFRTDKGLLLSLPEGITHGSYLGFRPEHVRLAPDGIPAEVAVVEPTGSETHVILRANSHQIVALFRERLTARPGETITIMPVAEHLHVFDGDGARI